jgi:polyisoprenoid-binding protein YceI
MPDKQAHTSLRPIWITVLLLSSGFLLIPQVHASVLHLDLEATHVTFELGGNLHNVEGSFKLVQGDIQFDPENGEVSGKIVLDATSAGTGNEKRDRKMHETVLESQIYPDIVFVPNRLEGEFHAQGTSNLRLLGTLSLHGAVHPLEIPATITSKAWILSGSATLTIPYVEWGLKDPSVFIFRVEKTVTMMLAITGSLAPDTVVAAGGGGGGWGRPPGCWGGA